LTVKATCPNGKLVGKVDSSSRIFSVAKRKKREVENQILIPTIKKIQYWDQGRVTV